MRILERVKFRNGVGIKLFVRTIEKDFSVAERLRRDGVSICLLIA